jgi:hybrid cluster-associated redox disulfide protein
MRNPSETPKSGPNAGLPFDKHTSVSDIMVNWPQTVPVFIKYQMLCVGCYAGPFHTIADACFEHDIAEQKLLHDLAIALAADA